LRTKSGHAGPSLELLMKQLEEKAWSSMKRRTVIRIVALGALTSKLDVVGGSVCHSSASTAWSVSNYKLRFFTPEENKLLDQLMEMIIPTDNQSPGAHAAQVSLFADLMVST